MRYGFFAAGLAAACLFATTSVQAASFPRIGVVNLQEVIAKSQAGQQASEKLQPLANKFQDYMKDSNNKLNALKEQLDKTDKKASNYAQLQKNFDDTRDQLQQTAIMMRDNLESNRQQLLQPIEGELSKVLNDYAKTHHYDIIISEDTAGALYSSEKYNVTQGVIEALNKDWAQMQKNQPKQGSSGGGK
jgi:outer membrane protein